MRKKFLFNLLFLLLLVGVDSWWRRRRRRRRCYRNCSLSSWSSWGSCSATCGWRGTQTRSRYKYYSEQCGGTCPSTVQSRSCNRRCCPVSCSYYYTSWSSCSGCGTNGRQYRRLIIRRNSYCGGTSCPRAGTYFRTCNTGR